jgi:hypothetical protein
MRPAQREDSGWERIGDIAEVGLDIVTDCVPDSFSLTGFLIIVAVFLVGLLIWAISLALQE